MNKFVLNLKSVLKQQGIFQISSFRKNKMGFYIGRILFNGCCYQITVEPKDLGYVMENYVSVVNQNKSYGYCMMSLYCNLESAEYFLQSFLERETK